jgi:NADH dehydrogenase
VADIKRLRLSGLIAWVIWLVVHLWYLIGFQNRLLVLIQWCFSFVTHGRGARIISEPIASGSQWSPPRRESDE